MFIEPVFVHVPVAGSYNSQVLVVTLPIEIPPATNTLPFNSKVVVIGRKHNGLSRLHDGNGDYHRG
jgi:hypothetical protein